jgi:membrane protease YdiL (CAAX protease family)
MSGVVASIAEEAGFRGYMQSAIERQHGPRTAILIVSLVFAAIHFSHGAGSTLPRLPYYLVISVIYGVLTWRTGSILPALVIHAGGDALAVYCKKFVSESVKFSAGLRKRKSLVDQCVEL